jgi:hypothetical protein
LSSRKMQKEIYILKSNGAEDYNGFKNRIFDLSNAVMEEYRPETLKICLTVKPPPLVSVIPFRSQKVAMLSVTRESVTRMDLICQSGGYLGSYLVEEAIPVGYEKSWEDGVPTPGVCLLTLFHKKPGLDQDSFIRRWHHGHTPLSLRLHPLWNYNRNVVHHTLDEDSKWYDGIVEEQFRKDSDLLNPLVFFGPPLKVPLHMYQVLKDTRSFIDMHRMETYLATEIHFKSPGRS